jgi:hypothetical protein
MNHEKKLQATLQDAAMIVLALRDDTVALANRTRIETERYKAGIIGTEEICYWYKCLIATVLSLAEGVCNRMRELTLTHAGEMNLSLSKRRSEELDPRRSAPLERSTSLAFRYFPKLFGIDFDFDSSTDSFRGFKALLDSREAYTHPKRYSDLYPIKFFPLLRPVSRWYLDNLKEVLKKCGTAAGLSTSYAETTPEPTTFKDSDLNPYLKIWENWAVSKDGVGFIENLGNVYFGLLKDTSRAMTMISDANRGSEIPAACAWRNFTRFLFYEIEGSVFLAGLQLHRYADSYQQPTKDLLIGDHEAVLERALSTLETFSRIFGKSVIIKRDAEHLTTFIQARSLRNRLTHPCDPGALTIKSEETSVLLHLLSWWHEEPARCLSIDAEKLVRLQVN